MTGRLLLANALELVIGLGVVSLLRAPLGTAYLAGLATVGIVSAHLALVGVSFGFPALAVGAGASLVVLALRRPAWTRPGRPGLWTLVGLGALAALLVRAWPTFAAKPLDDYDAWAIWGMKAKALTLLGWADPALFDSAAASPAHLDYPLLLPSLEAVASRAMGSFDPRLVHLQFLLLAVAGLAALHALLAPRAPRALLWPVLVALAAAPGFAGQLLTAYADIPVALLVAAGVVAAGRFVADGETRLLALASLFLAAACLTKNEGALFAAAAYAALLLATRRLRPLVLSALAVAVAVLPWQVWLAVHGIRSETLVGSRAFAIDHPGIGPLALQGLLEQAFSLRSWPLLLPLFGVAVAAAAGTRLGVFAWAWALVSLLALAWIYVVTPEEWSNLFAFSGDRVIDSLVVGAAALVPLLAAEGLSRIERR